MLFETRLFHYFAVIRGWGKPVALFHYALAGVNALTVGFALPAMLEIFFLGELSRLLKIGLRKEFLP